MAKQGRKIALALQGGGAHGAPVVIVAEHAAPKPLAALVASSGKSARFTGTQLTGCNPEVLAVVRNSRLGKRLGRDRMFFNVGGAVQRYEARLGADETQGLREGA